MDTLSSQRDFYRFAGQVAHRHGVSRAPVDEEDNGEEEATPFLARLPDGLHLTFERTPDERCPHARRFWRFRLSREDRFPSEDEVECCREAFHVPDEAYERRFVRLLRHPKSGRRLHAHIVELSWAEEVPANHD